MAKMRNQRVDLFEIKNSLQAALGDNADLYWNSLRNFTLAKLTKSEFDSNARAALGEDNIPLHNYLIAAILHNAHCSQLPPNYQAHATNGHINKPKNSVSRKRKQPPEVIQSKKPIKLTKTTIQEETPIVTMKELPQIHVVEKDVELCRDTLELPNLLTLKKRMYKIAMELGLSAVSEDCVALMMHSVEVHLKGILSKCMSIMRCRQRSEFLPPNIHLSSTGEPLIPPQFLNHTHYHSSYTTATHPNTPEHLTITTSNSTITNTNINSTTMAHNITTIRNNNINTNNTPGYDKVITIQDLMNCVEIVPIVLGEIPLNRERISVKQFPP